MHIYLAAASGFSIRLKVGGRFLKRRRMWVPRTHTANFQSNGSRLQNLIEKKKPLNFAGSRLLHKILAFFTQQIFWYYPLHLK